jgi:hypothetical protein
MTGFVACMVAALSCWQPESIERLGIEGQKITLSTVADDGVERKLSGLQVVPYDIPPGCIAGYYPECNGLIPLWHYEVKSRCPRPNPSRFEF